MTVVANKRGIVGPMYVDGKFAFNLAVAAAAITLDAPAAGEQLVITKIIVKGTVTAFTITNVGGATADLVAMPTSNEINFLDGIMAIDAGQATTITLTGATNIAVVGYIK